MTDVTFRDLSGMTEFRAAEALQASVWGEGDLPDPADLMMVIQAEGGLVGGAFVSGRLVGYIFGFPTRDPLVQHSHRLAVLPEARGLGLGLRLKQYQRDWCLERGITRVRWTFDPLRAVNAILNIHRLGAQSDTYLVNYYGEMAGINSGIGSDRLLVDWEIGSPVVAALARGETRAPAGVQPVAVPLPPEADQLASLEAGRIRDLRDGLRQALQSAFGDGLRIVDFDRRQRAYLLAR